MADATSVQKKASRLRAVLLRRYPGIFVRVHFNDQVEDGHGTYKGWCIEFESADPDTLIRYKLSPMSGLNTRVPFVSAVLPESTLSSANMIQILDGLDSHHILRMFVP
jgi:hypothetical protein